MHKHLQLVREFHQHFGIPQAEYQESAHLPEMDVVMRQALLLECGSETFKALAAGDLEKVLAGLTDLAFNALAAIASQGGDVVAGGANWRQDGSILSVVRVISEKINQCVSGETVHYSALYHVCEQLARGFLNADFDQAVHLLQQHLLAQAPQPAAHNYQQRLQQATINSNPDYSAALYE